MLMVSMMGGGMKAMKMRRLGRMVGMVMGMMMMGLEPSREKVGVMMVVVVIMKMVSSDDTRLTVGQRAYCLRGF